jgi:undecaprenyl-diphosphatase
MNILKVILLAIVQGLAELLPVSSSAHVVVAEKLMHMDPTSPQMTLLLVMLHTGTMFAVIVYFWNRWSLTYFRSGAAFQSAAVRVILATVLTAVVGYPLQKMVAHVLLPGAPKAEIEDLFGRLDLVAYALFCAGLLIVAAGLTRRSKSLEPLPTGRADQGGSHDPISIQQSALMGAVQGLCLPFRGFSRSGATISTGMLSGVSREPAETFSFALAVVLTPAVVGREALRLLHASHEAAAAGQPIDLKAGVVSSLLGMVFAFLAGLVALKWLSSWLEAGRWYLFGIYCILASIVVYFLHTQGY